MSHNFISKLWKLFDCQTFIRNIMTSARKQSSQQWSYVTGVFYYLLQKSLIRKENLFAFIKNQYRFITKISFNYSIFDDNCKLGDQGIDLIVKTELLFITDISLRGNNITHRGVKQMGKCKWKELKSIDLSINYIKNAGVKYLIKNMWKNLQRLNLRATGLTDDGAKILVKGQWPQLQHVNLQENHLTGQFCNHLIYSNWILFANIFWVSGSDQKQQRGYLQHIKLDQLRRVQLQKQRIKRSISKGENQ